MFLLTINCDKPKLICIAGFKSNKRKQSTSTREIKAGIKVRKLRLKDEEGKNNSENNKNKGHRAAKSKAVKLSLQGDFKRQ